MGGEKISWEQIGHHITPSDCWVVIEGKVYNMTDFLVEHPGGDEVLLRSSGLDATEKFNNVNHSEYAVSLRNARVVGEVESRQYPEGYVERIKAIKSEQLKKNKRIIKIDHPISREIVKRHNSEEDCWIIIGEKVYDVTTYLEDHPGGVSKIMEYAGSDATMGFEQAQHSVEAMEKKEKFCIGKVEKSSPLLAILAVIVVMAIVGAVLSR